jgi:hypothetical protein
MKKLFVTCVRCSHRQEFTGQFACCGCKKRLNHWSIIPQIQRQLEEVDDEADVNDWRKK